jgi:hypothetical protein
MDNYIQQLLQQTQQEYPFVMQHSPQVVLGTGQGYAETYPVGETGRPLGGGKFSRPSTLPIDQVGIEIYRPKDFTARDLAGEMLHIDPYANKIRDQLIKTWSPAQIKALQEHALDFDATLAEGRPVQDAIKNATDSALRGYAVGQWSPEVDKALNYTPQQIKLLNDLKSYIKTAPKEQMMSPMYTDPMGMSI